MSLLCIYVVKNVGEKSERTFYTQQLEALAKRHNYGIKLFVDWSEPLNSYIPKNSLVINIQDCPESDNCELLLLPDGWYHNGKTNKIAFKERMSFLQNISNVFINGKCSIDLYVGQSGTHPDEFPNYTIKSGDLADFLTKTIGVDGAEDGMRISIIP